MNLLPNEQNLKQAETLKGCATIKHFPQTCDCNSYNIKTQFPEEMMLLWNIRQLSMSIVEWIFFEFRTNNFNVWRSKTAFEASICTQPYVTIFFVRSGKRRINPLFGTTSERVLLSAETESLLLDGTQHVHNASVGVTRYQLVPWRQCSEPHVHECSHYQCCKIIFFINNNQQK